MQKYLSLEKLIVPLESELSLLRDVKMVSLDGQLALKKIELEDLVEKITDANHEILG